MFLSVIFNKLLPKSLALWLAPISLCCLAQQTKAQTPAKPWHNIERTIRYQPSGQDFVIKNGTRRFNRAIYGTNTAFRIEAGDLPEFALYLPGMGGNLKLGLIKGTESKWLINAQHIEARYRPGSMLYTITDPMLGAGTINLQVLAGANSETLILKAEMKNAGDVQLLWAYGGATGKKFSRDGDIGADPESSFYLKPEYCVNNRYQLKTGTFVLDFTAKATTEASRYENEQSPIKENKAEVSKNSITGVYPASVAVKQADADKQSAPLELYNSTSTGKPLVCGLIKDTAKPLYWMIGRGSLDKSYSQLAAEANKAEAARIKLTSRVQLNTPDPYINTLGGALAVAADAIWEAPSYMHGAVAWRMRLPAWRGAYVADPLGWHDRAWQHFSSYALSQIINPESGPVIADTALHLARQQEKLGNSMFSSGYIARNPGGDIRPHHYDMNLVFVDQMLTHFYWTGDIASVKKLWPTIKRHLVWEKRNYDHDGDGLYDAYCCIWASDALQYSGGGVTHSSAYNYRANFVAAQLAQIAGDDATPYKQEAEKIKTAIAKNLWMPGKGTYAEFKDLLGNKLLHTSPGLWTIYHAIDEGIPDAMQAYQSLRYVDTEIPHIPVVAKGLTGNNYLLSTTNWLPYTWSLNNVAMAENMHTTLAYWQGGRAEEAYKLWKSTLLESMYLGASPGNFQQLSFYDAIRGELYRDFGDPIGITARTLVEGLFGVKPDMLNSRLIIKPGLPAGWAYASLKVPDMSFDFKRTGNSDSYTISSSLPKTVSLNFELNARAAQVKQVTVNGKPVKWTCQTSAVGNPVIQIAAGTQKQYVIKLVWGTEAIIAATPETEGIAGQAYNQSFGKASVLKVNDPQGIFASHSFKANQLNYTLKPITGNHTAFVQLKQGALIWWQPLNVLVHASPVELKFDVEQAADQIKFAVINHAAEGAVQVQVNPELKSTYTQTVQVDAKGTSAPITVSAQHLMPGSNHIRLQYGGKVIDTAIINWRVNTGQAMQPVDLSARFNDEVTHIYTNQYLSPRPKSVTLQLPTQGIGNWCYPLTTAHIDDSGLRKAAGNKNLLELQQHINFATPGSAGKNIAFTSQWDNYPRSMNVPLNGSASHAYLLMAGSTNPMQTRLVNGTVTITYEDGSKQLLELRNPENWWPIEQDYDNDGFAFNPGAAKPLRVYLKTGTATLDFKDFTTIKGFSNKGIDGGAATVLDMWLDPSKKLKSLELKTITNDVVIGLMGVSLVR
ncbi:DUF4450 domain-containing protein [Mucilaginibacter terrae]|uniref:Alpha-L-rhamnosidase six-hairpin glycosidase domain-containing protein n=1 Tax=Mucilaginibacter terrae TaxID=1955052 RepID=A0ABU3GWB3_9SPHI|nr:DUF4450 domain-containing protein [Mucilaginibacter terrae]MDT3404059.1 hypothetical protein [Mucilaginibacter terrae]